MDTSFSLCRDKEEKIHKILFFPSSGLLTEFRPCRGLRTELLEVVWEYCGLGAPVCKWGTLPCAVGVVEVLQDSGVSVTSGKQSF